MDFYSTTLLIAVVTASLAAVAATAALWWRRRAHRRWRLLTAACAGLALLFALLSAIHHMRFGHGPGTPEPMGRGAFAGAHPAYFVVTAVAMSALLLAILARPRR